MHPFPGWPQHAYVAELEDWSSLGVDEFWERMRDRGRVWNFDEKVGGERMHDRGRVWNFDEKVGGEGRGGGCPGHAVALNLGAQACGIGGDAGGS